MQKVIYGIINKILTVRQPVKLLDDDRIIGISSLMIGVMILFILRTYPNDLLHYIENVWRVNSKLLGIIMILTGFILIRKNLHNFRIFLLLTIPVNIYIVSTIVFLTSVHKDNRDMLLLGHNIMFFFYILKSYLEKVYREVIIEFKK